MTTDVSFATVSDAPLAPERAMGSPLSSSSDLPITAAAGANAGASAGAAAGSGSGTATGAAAAAADVSTPLPLPPPSLQLGPTLSARYPTLVLRPYSPGREACPTNVLALLHNGAKRELADLVRFVIPFVRGAAASTIFQLDRNEGDDDEEEDNGENEEEKEEQRKKEKGEAVGRAEWWRLLMKFLFFVAETNDEVVGMLEATAASGAAFRKGMAGVRRRRKSIADRCEFTMEVVFRAADRALEEAGYKGGVAKSGGMAARVAADKLEGVVRFVLDTLEMGWQLAEEVDAMLPGLEIRGLEWVVADNLGGMGKADRGVMAFMCARWMGTEREVRAWAGRFGGMWGKLMYKGWRKTHKERVAFIDRLEAVTTTSVAAEEEEEEEEEEEGRS